LTASQFDVIGNEHKPIALERNRFAGENMTGFLPGKSRVFSSGHLSRLARLRGLLPRLPLALGFASGPGLITAHVMLMGGISSGVCT
jgi:hypothetical protein